MAPLVALLINAFLPVAVNEVKKKLAAEPNNGHPNTPAEIATTVAAPIAAVQTVVGSIKSKTAWVALGVAVLGLLEQRQDLITNLVGSNNLGLVMTGVGALMYVLRTLSTNSIVDKGESAPKE